MKSIEAAARRATSIAAAVAAAAVLLLSGCGGGGGNPGTCFGSAEVCSGAGGGGGGSNTGGSNGGGQGNAALILSPDIPSASVAGMCTVASQKQFIRSYLNEAYLWPDEIPAVDSALYSPEDYFNSLLVVTRDANGLPKDRFSFIIDNADADSQDTGAGYEYGVEWADDAQGRQRVAYVAAGGPAERAGIARGGEVVSVVSSTHTSWYPNAVGASVTFVYRPLAGADRTVTLVTERIQANPVPIASTVASAQGRRVGYVLFNDHNIGAQDRLIAAVASMASSGIDDLVLDMRYNRGGFVYTANSLASMVTGPANDGKVFERLKYNSKRAADDTAFTFSGKVEFGEVAYGTGAALPRLSLKRVYVLTTGSTCSASEAVINALRGVDVEVVQVGGTTCGKPFGFTRRDNCGKSLFPIEFQGFNDKGFGDYTAGFVATCPADDDFSHALSNPAEGLLGIALRHADQGACTPSTAVARVNPAAATPQPGGLKLESHPFHPGRVLTPAR